MDDPLNVEEYCLQLLVCMASVDGSFHPAEEDAVRENLSLLFPGMTDMDDRLQRARTKIRKWTQEEIESYLKDHHGLLNWLDERQRTALYGFLFEVLNADGRVNESEIRLLKLISPILIRP